MNWEDILKQNNPSPDDISFMQEMLNEVLSKVGSIYGLVPKQVSDRQQKGFYYSPEAVVDYNFAVGFEDGADGYVVDGDFSEQGGNLITSYVDWEFLWGGFKDEIMSLPEEYRDLGSSDDLTYYYVIGSHDYEDSTIGIRVKNEDPQIESLARAIHKKFEEKYGEGQESSYKPNVPYGISLEDGRMVNADEVNIKDDWKDSLRGKE